MIVSRWSRRRGSLDRGEEEIASRSGAIFSDTFFYYCFFPRLGSTAEVPQADPAWPVGRAGDPDRFESRGNSSACTPGAGPLTSRSIAPSSGKVGPCTALRAVRRGFVSGSAERNSGNSGPGRPGGAISQGDPARNWKPCLFSSSGARLMNARAVAAENHAQGFPHAKVGRCQRQAESTVPLADQRDRVFTVIGLGPGS